MLDFDKDKQIQINQILHIIKIASLSFPAIAFFQYYSNKYHSVLFFMHGLFLITILLVILSFYIFWNYIQSKISDNLTIKEWIDPVVSMFIAFLSVMFTGTYESNYKFLFMFVIISSSIEFSMRASLAISAISAAIILAIDLIFAPSGYVNSYFESDLVLVCVFLIISWTIGYYVNLGKKHVKSLKDLANIDGLTGLFNHRFFYDSLEEKIEQCKIKGTELSLLFIDIDNFKYYNDIYGHQKGDEVLRVIAAILQENVRKDNIVARYGGEEFAVLLPDIGEDIAIKVAERLRSAIDEYAFEGQGSLPNGNLTISVGVSCYPTKVKTLHDLIKGADDACYRAKFLRKNRVESYYSILEELQKDVNEPERELVASVKTLIAVINAKDKYTYRHVERVVYYCNLLAEKLDIDDKQKKDFIYAAYLHDIGKINIPEEILNKTERLTMEEWEIMKSHPQSAAEIIKNINSLKDIVPIILQHHERYDGAGYPNQLKGDEIEYLASLLSVVDSFDAMTSVRPYQQRKTFNEAIIELRRGSGTQFDPEAVEIFVDTIEELVT